VLERLLSTEPETDDENWSALRVARLKAEKRVQEAEVRLQAMESQVGVMQGDLKAADSRGRGPGRRSTHRVPGGAHPPTGHQTERARPL
jgi:hypothetical protein